MNLGGTSGSRLVTDWSDALWHSWGGWDCDVLGTGTARWKLGVYMSQITAVVIDYLTKSSAFKTETTQLIISVRSLLPVP